MNDETLRLLGEQPAIRTKTARQRRDEDHSCPACYRPVHTAGYCSRCVTAGADQRHMAMSR